MNTRDHTNAREDAERFTCARRCLLRVHVFTEWRDMPAELVLAAGTIDAIATAVAARLADRPPRQFVDTRELARILGVSVNVVYCRADELGAIRIGARVLFDPVDVANRMRRQPTDTPENTTTARRRRRSTGTVKLLPIRGQ